MSEEQLKEFWVTIQSDSALQQKLQGVTDPSAVVDIAKEAGFTISAGELQTARVELSVPMWTLLKQLDSDAVAGGYYKCYTKFWSFLSETVDANAVNAYFYTADPK